jgi:hypothetical protein
MYADELSNGMYVKDSKGLARRVTGRAIQERMNDIIFYQVPVEDGRLYFSENETVHVINNEGA